MAEAKTTETTEDDSMVDEYKLINLIADGTTTQIWEVKEEGATTSFVMKRLLPEPMKNPEIVATMKLEAKVAGALDHPNLIYLHKFVKSKQHVYLLMDYFRAPNLRSQLSSDRLSVQSRLRKLIESTAMALGHMHEKGWVHKDIKPENILISKSSEVKVIDFGLAVPVAKGLGKLFGKPKTVQGTRSYIAPETIKKLPLGPGADVYSLGITIFEVLTGKTPFHGENPKEVLLKHIGERPVAPSSINPNVAPEFDEFVLKMLAKKPEDRFQSMEEVVSSLRNVKMFKAEISEIIAQNKAKADQEEKESMQEKRLDSRADARLSQLVKDDPKLAAELIAQRKANTKKKPTPEPPKEKKPQPAPQQQQPPQPMPGGYPPQYQQPMYPPQPMPPGQPMPGQPMMYPPQYQGQPMPPQGYPPQGYPQQPYPPQQQPQQPPPQQQQPPQPQPGQPQPGQPAAPPPQPPPAAAPQSQAPPKPEQPPAPQQPAAQQSDDSKKQEKNDDDLPFMDELPDVI
ncbi:Serine/threonine-protein kinase PknB [Gimesia alba]|uniref:Serine/threonine-protein kinase PknB n=1 Tax=Gimesia alba TaxID=2527973 RepID=A0A517RE46_9PLAN|nr:serine/threonine-protein kinase [Gimesia alba]QDT42151.1 Serine/threonine-protein kinase PknB [Gimesia alba]